MVTIVLWIALLFCVVRLLFLSETHHELVTIRLRREPMGRGFQAAFNIHGSKFGINIDWSRIETRKD